MLFPTVDFGIFFLIVFAVSWALINTEHLRKYFLLAASYVFYGWWDWRFCGLLALSSLINFTAGRLVENAESVSKKRAIVASAVALNLIILGIFKYLGWFLESLSDVLISVGLERDIPLFDLVLPVGISFFTFQGISYVVDVYRGKIAAEKSPFDVALYISFFPQLVAGPIVRAAEFLPQLKVKPVLTDKMVALGLVLIAVGLFKKMIIANYLAVAYVDNIFFDPESYNWIDLLFATYAYAVQIYCDFSGYSDIAIGVAALLGYRFNENFNQPYRAKSLQDFWRRWHISLSTWLRDYLYIPLGGNRFGGFATYRNLLITMLLGGIWHGAAWTFVIWGAIHGGVLAIDRFITNLSGKGERGIFGLPAIIGVFVTFHIVCLAWIFFRSETLDVALIYLERLGSLAEGELALTVPLLLLIALPLAAQFAPKIWMDNLTAKLADGSALGRFMFFAASLLAIQWLAPEGVAPFIYFQF